MEGSRPLITRVEEIEWESRFAARTKRMQSSVIRELLKLTVQPEIISFAGGLPAPEFFPVREFLIFFSRKLLGRKAIKTFLPS